MRPSKQGLKPFEVRTPNLAFQRIQSAFASAPLFLERRQRFVTRKGG